MAIARVDVFDRCVLDRFAGIICVCVETLHDVCRSDSDTNVQIEYDHTIVHKGFPSFVCVCVCICVTACACMCGLVSQGVPGIRRNSVLSALNLGLSSE